MHKPESDMDSMHHDDHESRKHVSVGREVLDRLDPSSSHEGMLPSKQGLLIAVFIVIAFFWTVSAATLVFYEHIFDQSEINIGTVVFTLPPLLFLFFAILSFIWWISGAMASWNTWGRANPVTARWFWTIAFVVLLAVYFDPLNRLHFLITDFPMIGLVNSGFLAVYLYVAFLVIVFFWDNLTYGVKRSSAYISEWFDMFVSILLGMKITGLHLVRPRLTELFPEQKPNLAPTFRGRHILAFDESGEHLCIACMACERICPDRLIVVENIRNPETKKLVLTGFILDNSRCSFCGLCEDVCPTGAIRHTPEFEYSAFTRDDLVIDIFGEWIEKTKDMRKNTGETK